MPMNYYWLFRYEELVQLFGSWLGRLAKTSSIYFPSQIPILASDRNAARRPNHVLHPTFILVFVAFRKSRPPSRSVPYITITHTTGNKLCLPLFILNNKSCSLFLSTAGKTWLVGVNQYAEKIKMSILITRKKIGIMIQWRIYLANWSSYFSIHSQSCTRPDQLRNWNSCCLCQTCFKETMPQKKITAKLEIPCNHLRPRSFLRFCKRKRGNIFVQYLPGDKKNVRRC